MKTRSKQRAETPAKPEASATTVPAPNLRYQPLDPARYQPGIGLIGCGAITNEHLTAYRAAGYRVLGLCDIARASAENQREEFFPAADVYTDHRELLARRDIEVVDVTTHPAERVELIAAALAAGKHVLSQKPFVLDLDVGERLVEKAANQGVRLAVNQNGRWAPHFSYLRSAVEAGLLGDLTSAHFRVHWNHGWVKGTKFEEIKHLILYDFAIHWFDMLACIMGDRRPRRVFASVGKTGTQDIAPPLLGQAVVEYEAAQASLVFDADTRFGTHDETYVSGSKGVYRSTGPDLKCQQVSLQTEAGIARPELTGRWFPDGFHGAMGELLRAVEDDREPSHNARNNLGSLALCFAAVASAESGEPVVPGTVRRLPE